jgi:mannose-1-phosphate guanylyltransferase
MAERDILGNTELGEVLIEHTRDSYIRSEGPLVATLGIENLIIVATADAVLVAHKNHLQDVKGIVDRLRRDDHGRT